MKNEKKNEKGREKSLREPEGVQEAEEDGRETVEEDGDETTPRTRQFCFQDAPPLHIYKANFTPLLCAFLTLNFHILSKLRHMLPSKKMRFCLYIFFRSSSLVFNLKDLQIIKAKTSPHSSFKKCELFENF